MKPKLGRPREKAMMNPPRGGQCYKDWQTRPGFSGGPTGPYCPSGAGHGCQEGAPAATTGQPSA